MYMKRKALLAAFPLALLSLAPANAPAQDVTHAPPAAPVTAPAPPADIDAPAVAPVASAAPAVASAPVDVIVAPAPHASVVAPALPADIYAPPAPQAAPAAPGTPAAPADAPDAQAEFSETLFAEGNYLGVRVEELTRENAKAYGLSGEPRGVGVTQVLKGSPAERAGLRERDVIVRFDGEAVTSMRKLTRLITESSPEHTARVTVLRGGSEQELSVTLARRELLAPAAAGDLVGRFDLGDVKRLGDEWKLKADEWGKGFEAFGGDGPGAFALASSRRIGVTTTALGKQLADYFGVSHGVLVSSVESGSPADKAGLKAGDVLTEADGKQIDDASDLVRALGAKEEGEVTLTFVRDKQRKTVRVTPEKRQTPRTLFINPGGVRVATPVAAVVAPRLNMIPRAVTVPGIVVTPRLLRDPDFITPPVLLGPTRLRATPRVRVSPRVRVAPRVTVVGPGRIL